MRRWSLSARTAPSAAFYGLVIVFALLAPTVAAFGFFAIAVASLLPTRGGGRRARGT